MSSGSYMQVYVQCPFYAYDNAKDRISCEGVIPGTSVVNRFESAVEMMRQLEIFCCKNFEKCEIYEAVMKKYEEDL